MGRLGADPESISTKGGIMVHFNVATSEKYTGRDREQYEETEWHRVVVFGPFAQPCLDHLKKGREVLVEGKLKTRSYEDKMGLKRVVTEIIASRVCFIGKNGAGVSDVRY
jgi:single-strand DNA-binding protein